MACMIPTSLSARRAWIEIFDVQPLPEPATVALRKESVDRNTVGVGALLSNMKSLSARRAWIEIYTRLAITLKVTVALRKESVDRNFHYGIMDAPFHGRSPQGERG